MGCRLALLFVLIGLALGGQTGHIIASSATTVQISDSGSCQVDSTRLGIFKASSGQEHSALIKFDLASLIVPRYAADLVVLELQTDHSVLNQELIGRLKATVVKNEWDPATACSLPDPVPTLEFPARYVSGLTGGSFTLNLETAVDELLSMNITQLSIRLEADPAATSVNVALKSIGDDIVAPRLNFHLAETSVEPHLLSTNGSVTAGQEFEFHYIMPLNLQNGTDVVSLDELPEDGITVQLNEGNLEGKPVLFDVEEIERTAISARFSVKFAPVTAGVIRAAVLLFSNPIVGSPQAISVVPEAISPEHCTSEATVDDFFPNVRTYPMVGHETCLRARIRDLYDNPVDATGQVDLVIEGSQNSYNISSSSISLGYHEYCFVPTSVDQISLSLKYDGETLFGFPVTTHSVPGEFHHGWLVSNRETTVFEAGTMFELKFVGLDLSGHKTSIQTSDITFSINGSGTTELNVTKLEADVWNSTARIQGTLVQAGNYTVSITYHGEIAVLGITIIASDPIVSTCMVASFPDLEAGVASLLAIHCMDQYMNPVESGGLSLSLTAWNDGEETFSETFTDMDNGTYQCILETTMASDYVVRIGMPKPTNSSVFLDIHGSPFTFPVSAGPFDMTTSGFASELSEPVTALAGQDPFLAIVERDQFANNRSVHDPIANISATLVQQSTGFSVDVDVSLIGGTHHLLLGAWLHEAGQYELSVKVNEESLASASIVVTASPPNPAASTLAFASAGQHLQVGVPATFQITVKDRFGNLVEDGVKLSQFKVEAVHEGMQSTPCLLQSASPGVIYATFTPRTVGQIHILAKLQSVSLAGSPITSDVGPGSAFGPYSYAIGYGLQSAVAGETSFFLVRVRDTGSNDILVGGGDVTSTLERHADSHSDSTVSVPVVLTDNDDGTYSASYNVSEAGDYSLFIVVHGADVAHSPYSLKVHPNTIGADSLLDSLPLQESPIAGDVFYLNFTAFDNYGNQRVVGGDDVSVVFTHSDNSTYHATVHDNYDGTYNVTGYLTKSGLYEVSVSSEGAALPGMTASASFTVLPAMNSPEHASIGGTGTHSARSGEESTVVLKMRDHFYNEAINGSDNITATLSQTNLGGRMPNAPPVAITIEDTGNGTYFIRYSPFVAGEYQLSVRVAIGGEMVDVQVTEIAQGSTLPLSHILAQESPSIVNVIAGPASSEFSYLAGQSNMVKAGNPVHVILHAMDGHNNTCKVGGEDVTIVLEPGSNDETFMANVTDQSNGLYIIKLVPYASGTFELAPVINGVPLVHTTTISVRAAETDAQLSIAHLELSYELEAGVMHDFAIETMDQFRNPTPGTDGQLSVSLNCGGEHVFGNFTGGRAYITPTFAGHCNITTMFNHQHLIGSPGRAVVVGSWTSPLRTEAKGDGIITAQAGKVSSFIVVPLDQFGNPSTKGPVNVEVTDPNEFLLPITYADGHHLYNISYIPTATGAHQVHIAVGANEHKAPIPGSPFSVLVLPGPTSPKMTQVLGAGIAQARVGHQNEFIIVARDALGNMRATSTDHVEVETWTTDGMLRVVEHSLTDMGMGMYKVLYTAPAVETEVIFALLINGEYINDRNFTVDVVAELSVFECPDECNGHGVCNEETGLCACAEGWIGMDCSIPHLSCPLNCSDHGSCNTLTGACFCAPFYSGDYCECFEDACIPHNVTVKHRAHHVGPICVRDCSGHGECVAPDTCVCDVGFAGRGCEVKTEYRTIAMETGFLAIYEISTGRMFVSRTVTSDDAMCSGIELLENSRIDLHDTAFVRRPRNAVHTHVGDNRVLELDATTGNAVLIAFRNSELSAGRFTLTTEHVIGPMPALLESELTYLGANRLMVSSERESDVWIIDRQSDEMLVDDVTSFDWPERFMGHYAYFDHDLVGRYTPQGRFDIMAYNRASNDFEIETTHTGALPYISDLKANSSLALVPSAGDIWMAINPRTSDYRAFFCPVTDQGFRGCTYLNKGNMVKGFECPNVEVDTECGNLTASDCIKSDRCGFCGSTATCVQGTLEGPIGAACINNWVFNTPSFSKDFSYMGKDLVFDHEQNSGKYTVWNLEVDPRGASCPALSDSAAAGFFAATQGHQVLFAGPDMIDFDPLSGVYKLGACNHMDTVTECSLKCETWASGQWEHMRFRRLAILSTAPLMILDYSVRNGEYRVWEMTSRADYEAGVRLLKDPSFTGQIDVLRDAEVTALSLEHIIAHHPITSSTHFLRIGPSFELQIDLPPIRRQPQIATVQGQPKLIQFRYAAIGPDALLEYSDDGNWKFLHCHKFPMSADVFDGRGSVSCYVKSSGLPMPPACSTKQTEDECTSIPTCGWCGATERCYVGTSTGLCSKHEANCPVDDWVYEGPVDAIEADEAAEEECEELQHCRTCVGAVRCGWVSSLQKCHAGSPTGPSNMTIALATTGQDWSFSYCSGADACENLHSCGECAQRSYCGWCPSTSTCMTGTAKRPAFDVCPGASVGSDGKAIGYFYEHCLQEAI